ncbi:MAG TPA: flagellar hook-associated protein FlgL [Noviherbaspirillum sp.]
MRISTNTIFDKGVNRMSELQTSLARTQQQISTNKRIISPSDDPVASARALEVTNSQEINAKFAINRRNAKDTLSSAEGALQSVTQRLQDIKTLIVAAGNPILTDAERGYIVTELQGHYDDLIGLANSRDSVGDYIFSGYQSGTKPFAATANGASYSGDQGQRLAQVHTARQIEVTANGFEVFENVRSTGVNVSADASMPASAAAISPVYVVDGAALTGARYDIVLTDDGLGGYNYSVDNIDDALPAVATGTYQSGQPITFDGLQVEINGAVANNDRFTIRPDNSQSIFTSLKSLISTLQGPTASANDKLKMAGGLSVANSNIDHAIDHVLTVRASIGTSLKEIDSLDDLGEGLNIQFAETLAELQDLDYVQAITDLAKQQTALEAAQQSFIKVTSLSLFNYMS